MRDDLLPIGRFATLSRLSVKQLRRYDEMGLLVPAWVDEHSGYRYYLAGQARQALSIGLLRSLDVPLPVIAQVLAGRAGALEEVREDLAAELARRRRTLAALERVMSQGLPAVEVTVVEEPARTAVVAACVAEGPEDVARATSAAVRRALSGGTGGSGGGVELIGLFALEPVEGMSVRVASVGGGPAPGLVGEVLPGGRFARATHVGPFDQISLTAHAVLAWAAEHGHALRGPLREVYLSDPARTEPERLITQVMIPLGH
jgi:DNA-binding transcriptional MerR regulator